MSNEFEVRNWRKFQHYHNRSSTPPWIKLYSETIISEDWIALNDSGKLLMLSIMMLACRYDGEIPGDPKFLKKVLHLDKTPDLSPLVKCGFLKPLQHSLELVYTDARPPLAQSRVEESRVEDNKSDAIEKQAKEVLTFLNQITKRRWQMKPASLDPIKARLIEKHSVNDCKAVIEAKWGEWKFDEQMVKFVQPSTLFGKKNFAKYLAQIEAGPASVGSGTVIDTFEPEPEISDEDRAQTEAFLDSLKPEGD